MSQRSGLWRIHLARVPRISRACGEILLCTAAILIPPLLIADFVVWVLTHSPGGITPGQFLMLSFTPSSW